MASNTARYSKRQPTKRVYKYSQFVDSDDDFPDLDEASTFEIEVQQPDAAQQAIQQRAAAIRAQRGVQQQQQQRAPGGPVVQQQQQQPIGLQAQLELDEQSLADRAANIAHISTAVLWYALLNRSARSLAEAGIHKTPGGQLIPLAVHQERSSASRRAYTRGVRCRKPDCTQFMSCNNPESVIDTACAEVKLHKAALKDQGLTPAEISAGAAQFMAENAQRFAQDKAQALAQRAARRR